MRIKFLCFLFTSIISLTAYTQINEQFVGTAGENYTNGQAQLSFTLGEVAIETIVNTTNTLTQGFQQPNLLLTSLGKVNGFETFNIYPNPVTDILFVESETLNGLEITIMDMKGRLIKEVKNLDFDGSSINLSNITAGNYILLVKNLGTGNLVHSIKLTKLK